MPAEGDWANRSYLYHLNADNTERVRVRLRVEQGLVQQFTVQYETLIEHRWFPVLRYDTAHGFAHRDRIDRDGRNIEKLLLGTKEHYSEIVTSGIREIRDHWPTYREQFIGRSS